MKVLLVEDDAEDTLLLRMGLKEAGESFEMVDVPTLAQAEEHLAEGDFDVVLLDLGLPGSSGLHTLRKYQQFGKDTPVVVLTGLDDARTGLEAVRQGAAHYLVKGRDHAERVEEALTHAVERKENAGKAGTRKAAKLQICRADDVNDALTAQVKAGLAAGQTVVLATVHTPAKILMKSLGEEGIFFIDATGHAAKEGHPMVTVVDSPGMVETISMRLERACVRFGPNVRGIFHSLDTLVMYASSDMATEFVHGLGNRFQAIGVDLDLIASTGSGIANRLEPWVESQT